MLEKDPHSADIPVMKVIFGTGLLWGALWGAIGFFGPMLLGGGNQGPLLGIVITGPLGFLIGCVIGIYRVTAVGKRAGTPTTAWSPWQQSGLAIIAGFGVNFVVSVAAGAFIPGVGFDSLAAHLMRAANGLAAGYVVARLAPRAQLAHGGILAVITMTLSFLGSFGRLNPDAARNVVISGAVLSLAVLAGAYLQTRQVRQSIPA